MEFYRDPRSSDGLESWCGACKRAYNNERRHKDHGAALWGAIKVSADRRNLTTSVDLAWCRARLSGVERCELTGWRLNLGPRKAGGASDFGGNPYAPSFDRIDNSRGYHPDNIRVVCQFANLMMQSFSDEDMAPIIEALRKDAHGP